MTPKKMRTVRRMAQPGHYKPPRVGNINMPRVGRVGKMLPSLPKTGLKVPKPFEGR